MSEHIKAGRQELSSWKTFLGFVFWAFILTSLIGFATIKIEQSYLLSDSYFYDSVSHLFHNARLDARLPGEGRLALAAQEWVSNPRQPLRTASLLLFAPGLLAHPMGHMATALSMLFIFLVLLGWTIYQRTGHVFLHSEAWPCSVRRRFCSTLNSVWELTGWTSRHRF